MLRKQDPVAVLVGGASDGSSSGTPASEPGDPGRWALPDDTSGLFAVANLLDTLNVMSDTQVVRREPGSTFVSAESHAMYALRMTSQVTYWVLQSAVFLALIVRIIGLANIQPRMAIIPVSNDTAAPSLVNDSPRHLLTLLNLYVAADPH